MTDTTGLQVLPLAAGFSQQSGPVVGNVDVTWRETETVAEVRTAREGSRNADPGPIRDAESQKTSQPEGTAKENTIASGKKPDPDGVTCI